VLAKPRDWRPVGNILFNFEAFFPDEKRKDIVPASFSTVAVPIKKAMAQSAEAEGGTTAEKSDQKKSEQDKYYDREIEDMINNPYVIDFTSEFISLGGEPEGIKSLKIIYKCYAVPQLTRDQVSNLERWSITPITLDRYNEGMRYREEQERKRLEEKSKLRGKSVKQRSDASPAEEAMNADPHSRNKEPIVVTNMYVVCYHQSLEQVFNFYFTDNSEDFNESSTIFNQILDSVRFL
jgi:hypothetical protein